jgi:hypothetical protein
MNKFSLLSDGKCEKKEIANCKVIDFKEDSSTCLVCDSGHHFDVETGKCISVSGDDVVEFCESYQSDKSCSSCETGYVMDDAVCKDLGEAKVDNCLYYEEMVCKVCDFKFKFNSDGKCVEFDANISGCRVYTDAECTQCEEDYQVDYLNSIKLKENALDAAFKEKVKGDNYTKSMFDPDANKICLSKKHTNCLKSKDSLECEECLVGYYPDNSKTCLPNPVDAILECKIYSNLETCLECNHQHFLENDKCRRSTAVDHCTDYHNTQDKCISCASSENSYFLNGSECTMRVDSLNKCLTYSPNSDTCLTCDNANMYLNTSNICTERKEVTNCENYSTTKDFCSGCKDGFKLTDDSLKCLSLISDCKTYQASSEATENFTCDACEDTHYTTDNTTCILKSISKCQTYKTGNNLECEVCMDNHYLTPSKDACEPQSVSECVEYTPNTNNCAKCKEMFYINVDSCSAVDSSLKCLSSEGVANTCSECPGDHYLSGGSCIIRSNSHDPNCMMNKETSDDTKCSKCQDGKVEITSSLVLISQEDMDAMFCGKVDSTTGICVQCGEDADGTSTNVCAQAANTSSVCLQLIENTFEALSKNDGKCAKCRNYETHYHNLGTNSCLERSVYSSSNCAKLSPTTDACLGLPLEMTVYNYQNIGTCKATDDKTNLLIMDCKFYDKNDLNKCALCYLGMSPNEDPSQCLPPPGKEMIYSRSSDIYDVPLTNDFSADHPDYIANCFKYYYDHDTKKYSCFECKSDFVIIYDLEVTELFAYGQFEIVECKVKNDLKFYYSSNGIIAGAHSTCEAYRYVAEHDSHECIMCAPNTSAIYSSTSYANDATTPVTRNVISNCSSDIIKSQTAYDYTQYGADVEHAFVKLVGGTGCKDNSKHLVSFHASKTLENRSIEFPDVFSGEGDDMFKCLSNINSTIANCSWHWSPGVETKPTEDTMNVSKCLICKEGYKAVFDPVTRVITACEEIQNCEVTENLGKCSKCSAVTAIPFYIFDETKYRIVQDECPQTLPAHGANCLIMGNTECLVCKDTYVQDGSGVCVKIELDEGSNCMNTNLLDFRIPTPQDNLQKLVYYYLMGEALFEKHFGCKFCKEGNKQVLSFEANYKATVPILGYEDLGKMTLETIINCKYREEITSQKCKECSDGYLLKTDDATCIEAASVSTTHPNCKTLTTVSDKLICETCEETHVLDSNTNMCSIATNCMTRQEMDEFGSSSTPRCIICNEGFKPHETEFHLCVPIEETDTCLQYISDGNCIKCKDTSLKPVMFTDMSNGDSYHMCLDIDTTGLAFLEDPNYLILTLLKDPQEDSQIIFTRSIVIDNGNQLTIAPPMTGYPNKTVCLALPIDPNCEEPLGAVCFKCKSEFLLDTDTKKCISGSITGCSIYTDKDNCDTCKEGHFKNAQNKCVERTAQNCASVVSASNECETCNEGYYLKQNNGDCNADAANCDQCLVYTKNAGCKEMEENNDVCKTCEDDHYYDSTNTICARRTKLNCKEYEKEEDKCKSCDESQHFFKEDTGECVPPTNVNNCSEYNAATNKCSRCNDNFFLDQGDNECISNPDGIPGCKRYSSRTTCSGCGEDMYVQR